MNKIFQRLIRMTSITEHNKDSNSCRLEYAKNVFIYSVTFKTILFNKFILYIHFLQKTQTKKINKSGHITLLRAGFKFN